MEDSTSTSGADSHFEIDGKMEIKDSYLDYSRTECSHTETHAKNDKDGFQITKPQTSIY